MIKRDLLILIEELEEQIKDTEVAIQQAWLASDLMVEPIRSQFVVQLKSKQLQLDDNKQMLDYYKRVLKD